MTASALQALWYCSDPSAQTGAEGVRAASGCRGVTAGELWPARDTAHLFPAGGDFGVSFG